MEASRNTIPLVILAGRDRRAKRPDRAGFHNLDGFKAVSTTLDGKPLIQVAVERFRDTGLFDPIVIAGPESVYAALNLPARIVDTDGNFGDNLQAAVETLMAEAPHEQVGITTADIVPEPDDLERVLTDYLAHAPVDWYMANHRVEDPKKLQSSAYKPRYRIIPHGEREPIAVLPGHLVIANAAAGRRHLIYKVFDLAYDSRGKPVAYRHLYMMRRAVTTLLAADVRRIFRGQLPIISISLIWLGIRLATLLSRGDVEIERFEDVVRKMWATRRHRKRYPNRRGHFSSLDCRSLARDVDTVEEAQELTERGTLK